MSRSIKHHYIPQFYLKGFTGINGKFYIFDHKEGILKKGEYSPASHFFEKDRNTLFEGAESSDLIEEHHSRKDSRFAKVFANIQKYKAPLNLDVEDFVSLQWFIWDLYWRLPGNDELFKQYYSENLRFKDFWVVKDRRTGQIVDNEITRAFKNSDSFIRSSKSTLAEYLFVLNDKNDIDNPYDWRFSYASEGFSIMGDNPIILLVENGLDILDAQFIAPLSKNHYLFKIDKDLSIKKMPPEITVLLDALQFKNSKHYSACLNKKYILEIAKFAKVFSVENLKRMILEMIH